MTTHVGRKEFRGAPQRAELDQLRQRLRETEETLEAIRTGQVDAIVMHGNEGEKIYTLTSAEFPYRQLIEEMNQGVATLSADGIILYCNKSFAGIVQTPLQRVIGTAIERYLHPDHRRKFAGALAADGARDSNEEFILYPAKGAPIQALITFTRQEHTTETVSIIVTDQTERKRVAEALQRGYDELEDRIRERTSELAGEVVERRRAENEVRVLNEQLEQRVRDRTSELEHANHELEAFSYTISHDLKAPLRAIRSYLSILSETAETKYNDDEKSYIRIVHESVAEMAGMIEDLLEFSRLGRARVQHNRVEMRRLVESAVRECLRENSRIVRITLRQIYPVNGDSNLLTNVVRNIISNAFKFTRGKENAAIEIGSFENAGLLTYYVRDNGVGFEMQYYDKLFGVFQRLHGRTEFEGTGVGMAIAQRIVQRHGGKIWAESTPGEGTTFYFSLPHSPVAADPAVSERDIPEHVKQGG